MDALARAAEGGRMTKREILVDDLQQMEDSLRWLEENKTTVDAWGVLRAVCRAVWHLLGWTVKKIDEERRGSNGRGN